MRYCSKSYHLRTRCQNILYIERKLFEYLFIKFEEFIISVVDHCQVELHVDTKRYLFYNIRGIHIYARIILLLTHGLALITSKIGYLLRLTLQ